MLESMLNSHPSIHEKGEALKLLKGKHLDDSLSRIYSREAKRIKAVGFKIFPRHPFNDDSLLVWEKLKDMNELMLIHHKRKNLLRMLTSAKIALKTKIYGQKKWDNKVITLSERQIEFTADELNQGFERIKSSEKKYEEIFRKHSVIDTFYEDIMNNPEFEFQRIINYLKQEPAQFNIITKKQNPEKLSKLIVNYDSLKREFSNTKWITYFED
jgi:hypothetical protein